VRCAVVEAAWGCILVPATDCMSRLESPVFQKTDFGTGGEPLQELERVLPQDQISVPLPLVTGVMALVDSTSLA